MSKDLKPSQRIGKHGLSGRQKTILWVVLLLLFGGAGYAAYHYGARTVVEVPVARVRRGAFVLAVRTRGEVRSTRSLVLTAPQVPGLRITKLVTSGQAVNKGDVVVEFDAASQEQALLERQNTVDTIESSIGADQGIAQDDRRGRRPEPHDLRIQLGNLPSWMPARRRFSRPSKGRRTGSTSEFPRAVLTW